MGRWREVGMKKNWACDLQDIKLGEQLCELVILKYLEPGAEPVEIFTKNNIQQLGGVHVSKVYK